MSNDILVITEHFDGKVSDISYEMVGKANEIADELGGQVMAVMMGSGMASQASSFGTDSTIYVDDPNLAQFNPEAFGRVVEALVEEHAPRLTMFGSTTMGMDIAAWLAAKTDSESVAYVSNVEVEDDGLVVTSKIYGGKMMTEVFSEANQTVVSVLSGAFAADPGQGNTAATEIGSPVGLSDLRTQFVEWIRPEAGDVDITAQDKLVAVGRGIGSADNIELVSELAEALDATVAASRPITDAGWLPKTRQVGKSGVSVKSKLYLMLGISGAPEHLEGMKDAELIIAVNTDEGAPIFDVAHYGTTCDLFEVTEAMLEALG